MENPTAYGLALIAATDPATGEHIELQLTQYVINSLVYASVRELTSKGYQMSPFVIMAPGSIIADEGGTFIPWSTIPTHIEFGYSTASLGSVSPIYSTYFILSPTVGLVKIGKATDVAKRLQSLQIGSADKLLVLAVIDSDLETELHIRFGGLRQHGEWFSYTGELRDFIDSLRK